MTIREDELIERIRRRVPSAPGAVLRLGIGHDAAVLRPVAGKDWVVSCDSFIEGAHFLADGPPAGVVGYKSLARAASDLAAMGARPSVFLLGMVLPAARTGAWLDAMIAGMSRAARRFGFRLAGGDTARSPKGHDPKGNNTVALYLTVFGGILAGRAVGRSGARPGDAVFVSGRLGAAQLGLELVLRGMHRRHRWRRLLAPHYYPKLQLALGMWLARLGLATAMMDLSDGFSTDLARLCRSSSVGARIALDRIPVVAVPAALGARGFDGRSFALHGGEDYELLFTVRQRDVARIPRAFRGTRLTRIGEIVKGRGVLLTGPDGSTAPLSPGGWDHFRRSR
jgi:thiamine-monophosphate kinase